MIISRCRRAVDASILDHSPRSLVYRLVHLQSCIYHYIYIIAPRLSSRDGALYSSPSSSQPNLRRFASSSLVSGSSRGLSQSSNKVVSSSYISLGIGGRTNRSSFSVMTRGIPVITEVEGPASEFASVVAAVWFCGAPSRRGGSLRPVEGTAASRFSSVVAVWFWGARRGGSLRPVEGTAASRFSSVVAVWFCGARRGGSLRPCLGLASSPLFGV
jgi:hypothetical protein